MCWCCRSRTLHGRLSEAPPATPRLCKWFPSIAQQTGSPATNWWEFSYSDCELIIQNINQHTLGKVDTHHKQFDIRQQLSHELSREVSFEGHCPFHLVCMIQSDVYCHTLPVRESGVYCHLVQSFLPLLSLFLFVPIYCTITLSKYHCQKFQLSENEMLRLKDHSKLVPSHY